MATIEKLIKAFEALKVFQPAGSSIEDAVKKKDHPVSKKDKIINCNAVADCICAGNMRAIIDFPKFLGIAMETFLNLCDDQESDVRMVADECLNRTIKTLLETNLGRLQVELYKEIKKNGPSRILRAALWRFAEMAHLIRPQKCRPYIVNLLPCIGRICRREEESVQETLLSTMQKISPPLIGFANEAEVKALLKAFLPNLKSSSASCRRTAANSLALICQYSHSPMTFFNYLLGMLLEMILPVDAEQHLHTLLGVILCLRYMMPHLSENNHDEQGLRGSFGVMTKEKEQSVSKEQMLKLLQALLYFMGHTDHNVVTASLETLQQLLRNPSSNLVSILTTTGGITKTTIYSSDMAETPTSQNIPDVPSFSKMSEEGTGLEDDTDISESTDMSTFISGYESSIAERSNQGQSEEMGSEVVESEKQSGGDSDHVDAGIVIAATDMNYSGIEIGDLNEEASERSTLSQINTGSQETLLSIQSLSPTRQPLGKMEISQDMNGNPEIDEPSEASDLSEMSEQRDKTQYIGDITDNDEPPILYCIRVICCRFLLAGTPNNLILDRVVRVSNKALALGCISHAVSIYPKLFLQNLYKDVTPDHNQNIEDVLQYASHLDPQLKGNSTLVIGNLIRAALKESRGNFNKWLSNCPMEESLSIENLTNVILEIIDDDSSVAVRLALSAMQLCINPILYSVHSDLGLQALLKLLDVKDNPYWLCKVELLDLLGSINFKVIFHLESCCQSVQIGNNHYLGKLNVQDRILNDVVIPLLGSDDSRVRHCAAQNLVRMIQHFFYPSDHPQQDPVISIAKDHIENLLSSVMHEWTHELPPLVQGLVSPYHVGSRTLVIGSVESSLSRVVMALLEQLNTSNSKHLTYGCCHALFMLSKEFPATLYTHSWGCGPPTPLVSKDSSNKVMKRPPSRSLSSSSSFSMDELDSGSGGGSVNIIMSLLMSTSVSLDLSAHCDALLFAGNLIAGAAYKCLQCTDDFGGMMTKEKGDNSSWLAISDRVLVPLIDLLLTHVARLLNAFCHVIDEQTPGPPQIKASLPSLPNAPSLSPIKRKAKAGEKETTSSSPAGTPDSKQSQKQKEKEKEADKDKTKKEGLGAFYSLPHYMKIYDVLKGAYSNYKRSLELGIPDKFCNLLTATLEVFSQVLEICMLSDVGKYAEEFLNYLQSTVILEPTTSILCVQQLLKALFGTNLSSQWEPQQSPNLSRKPGKATRLTTNSKPGLYHYCFTQPYTHFTQSLAGATFRATSQTEPEDTVGMLNWLRKCIDRKVPAILRPNSKTDKTTITSYIRLFEPLVIKSLKQYTVTSCLELQKQVLDLLSQLVQLRVNYCLLDSDQVFIGFVIKQFEFIEEGQIRNSENLVPHIFSFLVMLSYEKYHSKSIIAMPKIIQLCDGIMASGLHPATHAIPALKPIVYDLFLLRGANKLDISRELETQREVVVSMLLRLINYPEALDMLVIVLQQCHKESEERWKRLSRQIIDAVLPVLSRQQIYLDTDDSLEILHRLFESVAPIVFRPVDILLKTLLQTPTDLDCLKNLQRWMCLVLSVLRVLIAQSKEEVILSRLMELRLKLNIYCRLTTDPLSDLNETISAFSPEETIAWFLIQVTGKCMDEICKKIDITGDYSHSSYNFLVQQLSQLLLYITHMFQSGLFRKVATSAMKHARMETPDCLYDIKELNKNFLSVSMILPTLSLQWCNILILLNFDDQTLWSEVMQTPKRFLKPGTSQSTNLDIPQTLFTHCCNLEILRRGGLVLFCDYACENITDAEHMTWLVINHVSDLIELAIESPVQDFISAIHRNPSASSLFVQAIHARCENVSKPSVIKKTLKCLEAIHPSQTGSLLTLLIDKFLNTHYLAVSRICDTITCRRVEMLLGDSNDGIKAQLPLEDLDKLLVFMHTNTLTTRHARLLSLLKKLRLRIHDEDTSSLIPEKPHPLSLPSSLEEIQINKESFMKIVKNQCYNLDSNPRECAQLLHHLPYADILAVTMTKEFRLCILTECISIGTYSTLTSNNEITEVLDKEGNKIPQEPTFDPLFKAAQLTLMRHMNNIINLLPCPHQVLLYDSDSSSKQTRYREKIEDLFMDTPWLEMVFSLTVSLNNYLVSISSFPWQPEVPTESHCDICRFCVLCTEMIDFMLHHDHLPTSEQLHTCLFCISLIMQHQQLSDLIGQKEYTSWVCSITAAIYQIFFSLVVSPGERLVPQSHVSNDEQMVQSQNDFHLIETACDQISELVQCLNTRLKTSTLPAFLQDYLRNIIIGLGRLPVLNSYARTPSLVWKIGWIPSPTGEPRTRLPPLPVDYLQDKEVLKEFVGRINSIGWISRKQFEETWMGFLAVLNPVTLSEDSEQHMISPEEEIERSQCMVIAVKTITSLLLQSTLTPVSGNPCSSMYEIRPRDKPLGFLHTRCGKKLTVIRGIIEKEIHNLYSGRPNKLYNFGGKDDKDLLRYMFDSNLERQLDTDDYCLGQLSIEAIWSVVGALDFQLSESTDSMESPLQESPRKHVHQQLVPLVTMEKRERSVAVSGLDIHSCLQFLLELYGQWMAPGASPKPTLMLKNEVVKSIVCLSDLFVEREQFDWMLDIFLEFQKNHPVEDELILQYITVGICKSAAVVGLETPTAEKVIKIIETSLKSPHLPTRIATLYGILYLLEAGVQDFTKTIIPIATDFLLRSLTFVSQLCITSQQYVLIMWATAFYIMENYHVDLKDFEFPSKILQLAVTTASGNEDSVSTPTYLTILKGLERLLLTDVLSQQDAEAIIKLAVDRLCLPSPQRSLAALGLMFTCMYSGKQYDQYSPVPRNTEPLAPNVYTFDALYQDSETLILAMERVTVLFDRIKKGYPYEARVITRVLPTFLADFFPPQDIMNKVIGEFISSQQPYPQLIAQVVFQVFNNLQQQEQQSLVQDWVMLSLSNFTQRTPVAMAVWSLTCFFISASTNQWLRALLSHVVARMGKMELVDQRLFCLAAQDFYNQIKSDDSKTRAFISTFQNVSQTAIPYQEVLVMLTSSISS